MHRIGRLVSSLAIAHVVFYGTAIAAPFPAEVVRLAEAYARAHPDELPPHRRSLLDEYAADYFTGFLSPGGGTTSQSRLFIEAYTKGQARWREGPKAQEQTFAGYGYVRVELTGTWSRGFETSLFEGEGVEGGGYWLSFLPGARSNAPGMRDLSKLESRRLLVVGYLSPKGQYGHLGMYGRELFAQSIKVLGD